MTVDEKLSRHPIKLDLGSGSINMQQPLDEWVRVDITPGPNVDIACDFVRLPMADGSVDELFSGDSIEHISPMNYDAVIGEWSRVLRAGGVFRGRTPNLHSTMVRYARGELAFQDAYGSLYGEPTKPYHQHYATFTVATLTELLARHRFGGFDFSGSPGNTDPNMAWWLVWKCTKI